MSLRNITSKYMGYFLIGMLKRGESWKYNLKLFPNNWGASWNSLKPKIFVFLSLRQKTILLLTNLNQIHINIRNSGIRFRHCLDLSIEVRYPLNWKCIFLINTEVWVNNGANTHGLVQKYYDGNFFLMYPYIHEWIKSLS